MLNNRFKVLQVLGEGKQGKVYLGKDMLSEGEGGAAASSPSLRGGGQVAIKVLQLPVGKERERFHREITALKRLSGHPGILNATFATEDALWPKSDGTLMPVALVVTEVAAGGELFDMVFHTGPFPELHARLVGRALVSALAHAHAHGVWHRDLKPENILFTADHEVKVADFGMAQLVPDSRSDPVPVSGSLSQFVRTHCGTHGYMAPEVRTGRDEYDAAAADVWSLGVVLFVLLSGTQPFAEAKLPGDWWYTRVAHRQWEAYWDAMAPTAHFSETARDLLQGMFAVDPAARLTLAQVAAHPWITGPALDSASARAEMDRRAGVLAKAKAEAAAAAKRTAMTAMLSDVDLLGGGVMRGTEDALVSAPALPSPPPPGWHPAHVFTAVGAPQEIVSALAGVVEPMCAAAPAVQLSEEAVGMTAAVGHVGVQCQVFDAGEGAVEVLVRHHAGNSNGQVIVGEDPVEDGTWSSEEAFWGVFEQLAVGVGGFEPAARSLPVPQAPAADQTDTCE